MSELGAVMGVEVVPIVDRLDQSNLSFFRVSKGLGIQRGEAHGLLKGEDLYLIFNIWATLDLGINWWSKSSPGTGEGREERRLMSGCGWA